MPRRVLFAAALVIPICAVTRARADDGQTSSLSWVELPGAESCGGAAGIAQAVERRLGRSALVPPSVATFSIEGRAERDGAGLRAVLVVRDRTGAQLGEREIESAGADCRDLREKVSLAVALMIDPDASLHPPAAASPPPAASPPSAASPPPLTPPAPSVESMPAVAPSPVAPATSSAPATPVPRPVAKPAIVDPDEHSGAAEPNEVPVDNAPPPSWGVAPALSAAIGVGFMPSVSLGAVLDATLRPPRFWPLRFYAGGWGSQTVAASSAASARFSSAFGGLALCPLHLSAGRVSLLACGAAQVGFMSAAPVGFTNGGSVFTFHLVPDAHMSIALASGISIRAGGSLALGVRRGQFVFDIPSGQQALFEPPWLAGTLDLGLAIALP